MTLGTHVAFASVLYLGGATLFGYRPDWIGWLLAAVASLLPDVDLLPAKIGRLFWWLSVPLERRFGHRTLTHSLVALSAVAALSGPLMAIQPLYGGAVIGGYWSHLWIDRLNIRGVDLFWPAPVRLVTPGNRNWRMAVGSKAEMILLSVLLVAGEPLRVVAERVDLRGHTLRWLVSRIGQTRPYYLLGEVEIPDGRGPALAGRLDSVDSYNPAS